MDYKDERALPGDQFLSFLHLFPLLEPLGRGSPTPAP
jgi:hypothetical protein